MTQYEISSSTNPRPLGDTERLTCLTGSLGGTLAAEALTCVPLLGARQQPGDIRERGRGYLFSEKKMGDRDTGD